MKQTSPFPFNFHLFSSDVYQALAVEVLVTQKLRLEVEMLSC